MSEPTWHQRYLLISVAILFILMAAVMLVTWGTRESGYAARLARRVRAEVPVGSSEQRVMNWLRQNCKYLPMKLTGDTMDTFQGATMTELAGIPEKHVASYIKNTIPREDWISDYVRVYFFLDRDGKVIGHYFLTFAEIAEMEARLSSLPLLPPSASPARGSAP